MEMKERVKECEKELQIRGARERKKGRDKNNERYEEKEKEKLIKCQNEVKFERQEGMNNKNYILVYLFTNLSLMCHGNI